MALNLAGASRPGRANNSGHANANLHIIVITADEETARVLETFTGKAGRGQLSRVARTRLIAAAKEAQSEGPLTSQVLARRFVQFFKPAVNSGSEDTTFSMRERQVMEGLSKGQAYKGIAMDLGVSLDTVRTYLRRIYGKLGVHSRTDAVVRFLSQTNRAVRA
jgi:DNA-binding NarL/FixJ family response regulator